MCSRIVVVTFAVLSLANGGPLASAPRFVGHKESVRQVVFSPDGTLLASASWDKSVRLWNVASGKEVFELTGHTDEVNSVVFSPDGKLLASAGRDKTVRLWDVATGKGIRTLSGHHDCVRAVDFSPDGKRLVSGDEDGLVQLWDPLTGEALLWIHLRACLDYLCFSPDGRRLAAVGGNWVWLLDPATGKAVLEMDRHPGCAGDWVAFSPDGKRVVSGHCHWHIWDATTGKRLHELKGEVPWGRTHGIAFSPDGKVLVTGNAEGRLHLWDPSTGDLIREWRREKNGITSVAFSPDGTRLAWCCDDGSIRVEKAPTEAPGNWPQWRGPNRDGISPETGLLKQWPEGGPPLLWKAERLGTGNAPVSVAAGRIVSVGYRNMQEVVFALDGNGKELWATPISPQRETIAMSWLSQRAPTLDDARVYAVSNMGELVCLDAVNGKLLWRKDYVKDFGGSRHLWGYCDYPLVDNDRLIVCPGGAQAAIVALNKQTGTTIWQSAVPDKKCTSDYAAVIVTDAGGVRQYVKMFREGLLSVRASDGKFLWRYDKVSSGTINFPTAAARGDLLHVAGGYGAGVALLRPSFKEDKAEVEELYLLKATKLDRWSTGAIVLGDELHLTGPTLSCLDFKTGQMKFESERRQGSLAPVYADGHFYCRQENGKMLLVAIGEKEYQVRGSFGIERPRQAFSWTMPTVAGGRLYLRDQDELYCYDIRAKPRSRGPRPPFVPTPHDVVEKMLELAEVKKTDTVVDLGCGDGRIVVTAAQKHGCKAIGYDLDKECLRLARANAKENRLEERVQIIEEDFFNVDLSKVDVVTLYLWPTTNVKLVPQLEKMKPGSRIVSHAADMKGVLPDKTITVTSKDDGQERKLYLWTLPLKKETPAK